RGEREWKSEAKGFMRHGTSALIDRRRSCSDARDRRTRDAAHAIVSRPWHRRCARRGVEFDATTDALVHAIAVRSASMPAKKALPTDAIIKELREFGLRYPGTHTKSPWPGHLDLAVKDKTFAYLPPEGEPFSISCKLPQSNAMALMLSGVKPTGYG